jgi:predicted transcriptional regulator
MSSKAIKLDDATYDRLKSLGTTRKRSPHWLMKEAITQFLEREEEAERIRQETLDRLEHYKATGEAISHDVVDAWLKTWGTDQEGKCPVP